MRSVSFVFIFFLAFLCCTVKVYDTNMLLNDFKTEGFLDRDHYQVIIKGFPDKRSRGLVQRRECAIKDARTKMNEIIIDSLANYCLDYQFERLAIKDESDVLNLMKVKSKLRKRMMKYMRFGYIAFEYYNEDHSAVIVFRIYKEDLLSNIESTKTKFRLKSYKEG